MVQPFCSCVAPVGIGAAVFPNEVVVAYILAAEFDLSLQFVDDMGML